MPAGLFIFYDVVLASAVHYCLMITCFALHFCHEESKEKLNIGQKTCFLLKIADIFQFLCLKTVNLCRLTLNLCLFSRCGGTQCGSRSSISEDGVPDGHSIAGSASSTLKCSSHSYLGTYLCGTPWPRAGQR